MKNKIFICLVLILIISFVQVKALDLQREDRIDFGHVMRVRNISIEPGSLAPGDSGILTMKIQNFANFPIYDVRVQLKPPSGISLLNDISTIKIVRLETGESEELKYNVIVLPTTSEGIYEIPYIIDYVNHIGTERQDNDTFSVIVKSIPKVFVRIEDSGIYKGNNLGDITIKFVNNDIADIKFLTVELQDSEDYEIISGNKEYIGDLDSDDFESVTFRLKILNKKKDNIKLPLNIYYKDSLNNDYNDTLEATLNIRTASELGKKNNGTAFVILGIIIIGIVIFYVYKKMKKKKHQQHHHLLHRG